MKSCNNLYENLFKVFLNKKDLPKLASREN